MTLAGVGRLNSWWYQLQAAVNHQELVLRNRHIRRTFSRGFCSTKPRVPHRSLLCTVQQCC